MTVDSQTVSMVNTGAALFWNAGWARRCSSRNEMTNQNREFDKKVSRDHNKS